MEKQNNIPKLRFPEFSDGWEMKKLGDLLEFKNGINATKEQYGKGYKFINVLDILNNDFITHDKIIGSVEVSEDIFNKYPVNYGDILFQRSSETREEVGTASVYLDKENSATFGGFVIRGKKIGDYEPFFLSRLLQTDLSRNQITSKSGGSTRYNVGQEILVSVELPFPTLPEQQKIATFLSTVDEKLQALKKKKSLLETYKKGIMQKLFSQEIRFKDDEGNDFENWEVKTLGEYIDVISGVALKSEEISDNPEGTPILRGINITEGYIRHSSEIDRFFLSDNINSYSKFLLQENDIVIGMDGSKVGKNVSLIKVFDVGAILIQRVARIRPTKKSDIHFIYQCIFSKAFQDYVDIVNTSSGIPHISLQQIKDYGMDFPSLPEQTKIANFLTAIDEKIERVDTQIKQTELWKKGLLQQMFV